MRAKILLASLALPIAMLDVSAAMAQDGSRIVMRRPLEAPASPSSAPGPSTCGGPSNPCPETCDFTRPRWVSDTSDSSVCTGSLAPANAHCEAMDSSNAMIAVPDSVCLEDASSYSARCGAFIGMPGSGAVAGPRPQTIPGSMNCELSSEVVLVSVGAERVATGAMGGDGIWRIFGFEGSTPASCTYPSAAPAAIECRVNGVPSDPSNCSVDAYSALYSQNLVPVSPNGVTPSDIRFAQWVRPGTETSGCVADWETSEGSVPPGCGTVTIPITVTCEAQNAQSGDVPEEELSCDPSTRPAESRQTQDYRACTIAMESSNWSSYSGTCGSVQRTRQAYCRRSDGTALNLSDPACSQLVSDYCTNLSPGVSCEGQTATVITVREIADLGACPDPELTNFEWATEEWGAWSATCGAATRSRSVSCVNGYDTVVDDDECNPELRPSNSESATRTVGCSGPKYCSGSNVISSLVNSSNVDRSADCASLGATCMEKSYVNNGSTASYVSSCYGASSSVSTAPNQTTAVTVHGKQYTFGADGWCVYGDSPARDCLRDAVSITPATPTPPTVLPHCTAYSKQVTGDTCEGGTLIATGEYHRYSNGHPRGAGEESSGMTSELACINAGGNCWQEQRLPHTEYGEWSEDNDYFECHAGATSISPDGTADGLPNVTDPEYFDAGFLSCTASTNPCDASDPSYNTYGGRVWVNDPSEQPQTFVDQCAAASGACYVTMQTGAVENEQAGGWEIFDTACFRKNGDGSFSQVFRTEWNNHN
ncbi:thrombospondin type-1 domain-containing protein [uncultured Salinicola sp.]|mgnify:CR=1 FL=1|uniref:thrombospondin type-1 domain-containing protein n=1 Tax=uncultured Salinicola sp. TaxID=1193542 RepID=UPI002635D063|nr:thrombospondin type-1 domain-containing protein [uncultured Salinicola sp.]